MKRNFLYNETVLAFLDRNAIDPEKVSDHVIMTTKDLNVIAERFGIFKERVKKKVSIADIYGVDSKWSDVSDDIFVALNNYFDENGDTYHARSCSCLYYTAEKMLEDYSFEREPVCLKKVDPFAYVVSSNGMHRYMALRTLYLGEVSKNLDKVHDINQKYTITAFVEELDEIKTYCNFILSSIAGLTVKMEYDDNYRRTGRVLLKNSALKDSIDDEELLEITRRIVSSYPDFIQNNLRFEPFKNFVDNILYHSEKESHYGK